VTNEGSFIDVSMLDSTLVSMGWVISNYLIAGEKPMPMGNANFTAAPSGTFRTGDGLLNIAANKQEQFEALAKVTGREDLITDARFAGREDRKMHRAALTAELESALRAKSAAAWEPILIRLGIPAGRVVTVPQALESPQVKHRELLQHFDTVPGIERRITVALAGFKMSGANPSVSLPPPRLGEHTSAILQEAGYTDAEIADLRAAGAV